MLPMGRPKGFSREQVLDKAIQVFWKKGFADTSLQDLEKATGVNKSGLYSEFKDKDEIFIESLKRYSNTVGILEILNKEPLGLKNIEIFLLVNNERHGQKGCFFTNSVREVSIIPPRAKSLILSEMDIVREAVLKNLAQTNLKKDAESIATMILTFRSGICLALNFGSDDKLKSQVRDFLKLILDA